MASDSGSIIKIALVGGAAYFIYKYMSQPATQTVVAPPTTNTTPPGNTTVAPNPPSPPAFNSLDAIGARIMADTGGTNPSYTADQWNFVLAKQLPAGTTPPDPMAVFTQAGFDRNTPMTFPQWWGVMAPYLKANMGLSGYGVLYGLGAFVQRRRRRHA